MGARPTSFVSAASVPVVEPASTSRVWSDQQQVIFEWFEHPLGIKSGHFNTVQHLVVRARAGCLAGDTYISINRAGKGWTLPIAELVAKANGIPWPKSKGWDLSIPTMVQREQDGVIRLGKLKAAWGSGVKQTYTLTTDSGKTIRATDEHPFMTTTGWAPLGDLVPKGLVLTRGGRTKSCSTPKTTYSDESGMWNHPFACLKTPNQSHPVGQARVPTHRLVAEAYMNHLGYQEFVWQVRAGDMVGLRFLDPAFFAVHHRDRDPKHNTIDNLEVLTHEEHARLHGLEDSMANVLFKTQYEQIVAIEPFDMEDTFDIEVEDDPHNFIANGFVVHNTGKTTTIIEGVNRAPESDMLICAFNKAIADELTMRLTHRRAEARTLHSVGLQCIRRQWRGLPVANGSVRADQLTDAVTDPTTPKPIKRLISLLHSKAREMEPTSATPETLTRLALQFGLEPDDHWRSYNTDFVVEHALAATDYATKTPPTHDIGIDYADMMFLPLVWDLLPPTYDLVVVDETQDLTVAQLEMIQRLATGRICIVGDDRQAIYGFRGADTGSIDRLKRELGAAELPLTTTYRCGQSIVRNAQRLVPDIVAGSSNPEGVVDSCEYEELLQQAQPGDFILSRLNAPLVSIVLQLAQRGKRARMKGRDIGAGVLQVIRKLKLQDSDSVDTLLVRLDDWERRTVTRLASFGELDMVDRCHDQADMIRALAEDSDVQTVGQVQKQVDWLFTENPEVADQIVCSSVHKAKGLETTRAFILQESFYRRGVTNEEVNLEYVAITRAKTQLTRVVGISSLTRAPNSRRR